MARGVNKVILIGNLGDEPTIRTTNTGRNVASISMVTNEMRRNPDTGEYTEFAEWHRVTMWGKLAEIAQQYLHKGSQIYIEGKLRTRSYEKDGIKRYTTEVVADEMQMLGSPRNAGGSTGDYNDGYSKPQAPRSNYNSQNGSWGGSQPSGGMGGQSAGYGSTQPSGYGQPQAQPAPAPAQPAMVTGGNDLDGDIIPF